MVFNSITFDGINSLDYDVYVTGEAVFNAPERVIEMINVPGRNGAVAIDQGRFENVLVSYPAGAFASDQAGFADKIADFRNELVSRHAYMRLVDSYNTDEFRMGIYHSGLEIIPVSNVKAGEFTIEFDCKPQRWLLSGETPQTFTSTGTITNPTLFPARPLLKVTGAGILTVGTQTMTIIERSDPASVLYIDCESQEAWEMVGTAMISRNDYVQNAGADFPTLVAGSNDVILGTGITQIEITPRWWRI